MKTKISRKVHLVATTGTPDREIETSGRDATALCGEKILTAKYVGKLDIVERELQQCRGTIFLCPDCLPKLREAFKESTYIYGVLPAVDADRVNSLGREED